jgi:hypothetical protein
MDIKPAAPRKQPEHTPEIVALLKDRVNAATTFVLQEDEDPHFNKSQEDNDKLEVLHVTSDSINTKVLESDGQRVNGAPIRHGDGESMRVTFRGWKYVLLVNAARRGDNSIKTVTVCYLRDRDTYAALRKAVGLPAY